MSPGNCETVFLPSGAENQGRVEDGERAGRGQAGLPLLSVKEEPGDRRGGMVRARVSPLL